MLRTLIGSSCKGRQFIGWMLLAGIAPVLASDETGVLQQVQAQLTDPGFIHSLSEQRRALQQLSSTSASFKREENLLPQAALQNPVSEQLQTAVTAQGNNQKPQRMGGSLLLFVSLSLPDDLLKHYFQEAEKYGAAVIFRGFADNDFQKMQQAMHARGITGGYQIDPVATQKYGIQAVPAFVLLLEPEPACQTSTCPVAAFVKAEGVSSIRDFLDTAVRRVPDSAKVVKQWSGY